MTEKSPSSPEYLEPERHNDVYSYTDMSTSTDPVPQSQLSQPVPPVTRRNREENPPPYERVTPPSYQATVVTLDDHLYNPRSHSQQYEGPSEGQIYESYEYVSGDYSQVRNDNRGCPAPLQAPPLPGRPHNYAQTQPPQNHWPPQHHQPPHHHQAPQQQQWSTPTAATQVVVERTGKAWLPWSIINIFCCICLGIPATVLSCDVKRENEAGRYESARSKSSTILILNIIGTTCFGVSLLIILGITIPIVVAVNNVSSYNNNA